MWKNSLLIIVLLSLLASPLMAGDPLDTNDGPTITMGIEEACEMAYKYPACESCWTTCLYAMMADSFQTNPWTWDW